MRTNFFANGIFLCYIYLINYLHSQVESEEKHEEIHKTISGRFSNHLYDVRYASMRFTFLYVTEGHAGSG